MGVTKRQTLVAQETLAARWGSDPELKEQDPQATLRPPSEVLAATALLSLAALMRRRIRLEPRSVREAEDRSFEFHPRHHSS